MAVGGVGWAHFVQASTRHDSPRDSYTKQEDISNGRQHHPSPLFGELESREHFLDCLPLLAPKHLSRQLNVFSYILYGKNLLWAQLYLHRRFPLFSPRVRRQTGPVGGSDRRPAVKQIRIKSLGFTANVFKPANRGVKAKQHIGVDFSGD